VSRVEKPERESWRTWQTS